MLYQKKTLQSTLEIIQYIHHLPLEMGNSADMEGICLASH